MASAERGIGAPDAATGIALRQRNLVLFCDGTNNTLTGGIEDTNVLKLFGYLRHHRSSIESLLYYDPGVGSPDSAPPTGLLDLIKRRWTRIAGLASGQGVYDNIGEGYRFLMRHFDERIDDRIFCFGFSRGAFTARAIVGMVNLFGILRPEHEELIPTLVRIYFSQPPIEEQARGRKNWRRSLARALHRGFARPGQEGARGAQGGEEATAATRNRLAEQVRRNFARPADVFWVGVWDTVESVGLPPFGSRDNPATATFADKKHMLNVRHALAFDEHRWPFLPRVYDSPSRVDVPAVDRFNRPITRTLRQLWFPGVHCDVGGSYPAQSAESPRYPHGRTGLPDASMVWMVNEVAAKLGVPPLSSLPAGSDAFGMPLPESFVGTLPLRHDALHDTPFWALAGMTVRRMTTEVVRIPKGKKKIPVDVVAESPPAPFQGPSVWDERRSLPWLLFAVVAAAAFLLLSGWQLQQLPFLQSRLPAPGGWEECLIRSAVAPWEFARHQLGLLLHGWPRDLWWIRQERAALFLGLAWDLAFLLAAAYLLSRLASRVFTWMAGWRKPGDHRSRWLLAIGWLPALAFGADALEDLSTMAATVIDLVGMPKVAGLALGAMSLCSVVKVLAWGLGIVLFGGGRLLLAVLPVKTVGKVGRKT
ncbi:T6SS phospholipase effector Tle1-like catalytic domain-containing protein [Roseateles chitinivorans]|uniref:T6SS phospholipase effector Tle1-like catalytic domain-containing protein n=1 Tax=Roseateles chitinivorans TaxID=2917965 RepID=UPI003D668B54